MSDVDLDAIYAELEATRDERRNRPPERRINRRQKKAPYPEAALADAMLLRMPYVTLGEVRRVFGSRNKKQRV